MDAEPPPTRPFQPQYAPDRAQASPHTHTLPPVTQPHPHSPTRTFHPSTLPSPLLLLPPYLGVSKEQALRLSAAAAVDVGLDAGAAPLHQRVRHVAEQLGLQRAAGEAGAPDVALAGGEGGVTFMIS